MHITAAARHLSTFTGAVRAIEAAGTIAGAVVAIAAVIGIVWKLRPLVRESLGLLRQIRDASGGVQVLAGELRELAGSFVSFAAALAERIDDNSSRLADMAELYTDLAAAVSRLERRTLAVEQVLRRRRNEHRKTDDG